ncbi:uncharacterized protein LOC114323679 isoform X2 [Camellia sinensis]|uniref:uncharacterized protein LOC114323679 isoform X2 n=1 Tax=Camellia sinensis TaxID=4442 RepID=UPI001036B78A|nr:uncharacterized protein LOC114323679 isoform X2 [Camellia sinensis]
MCGENMWRTIMLRHVESGFNLKAGDLDFSSRDWFISYDSSTKYIETQLDKLSESWSPGLPMLQQTNVFYPPKVLRVLKTAALLGFSWILVFATLPVIPFCIIFLCCKPLSMEAFRLACFAIGDIPWVPLCGSESFVFISWLYALSAVSSWL